MADSCAQALSGSRPWRAPPSSTRSSRSSRRPAPSWPAASTTSRPSEQSHGWPSPTSPTGARSRSRRTAPCAPSPSLTATPRRSRWPSTSSSATPRTPRPRPGTYQVLRTGESILIPEVTDEMLVMGAQSEEHLAMLRDLALYSALTVPLAADNRVLGTISWINGESGRRFTDRRHPLRGGPRSPRRHRHRQRAAAQRAPRGRGPPAGRRTPGGAARPAGLAARCDLHLGRPRRRSAGTSTTSSRSATVAWPWPSAT